MSKEWESGDRTTINLSWVLWPLIVCVIFFLEDELAQELDQSDSNEDDTQEISLEVEEKLLKDEPEC